MLGLGSYPVNDFPDQIGTQFLKWENHCRGENSQDYTLTMARGWESKSVEAQIEESDSKASASNQLLSREAVRAQNEKSDLLLSRKRVKQQLEVSTNDRYSELLRRTLADLDSRIAQD